MHCIHLPRCWACSLSHARTRTCTRARAGPRVLPQQAPDALGPHAWQPHHRLLGQQGAALQGEQRAGCAHAARPAGCSTAQQDGAHAVHDVHAHASPPHTPSSPLLTSPPPFHHLRPLTDLPLSPPPPSAAGGPRPVRPPLPGRPGRPGRGAHAALDRPRAHHRARHGHREGAGQIHMDLWSCTSAVHCPAGQEGSVKVSARAAHATRLAWLSLCAVLVLGMRRSRASIGGVSAQGVAILPWV